MNSRTFAGILALLTGVFIVLNFTVEGTGTIFFISSLSAIRWLPELET